MVIVCVLAQYGSVAMVNAMLFVLLLRVLAVNFRARWEGGGNVLRTDALYRKVRCYKTSAHCAVPLLWTGGGVKVRSSAPAVRLRSLSARNEEATSGRTRIHPTNHCLWLAHGRRLLFAQFHCCLAGGVNMSSMDLEKLKMTGAGRAMAVLTSGGDAQGHLKVCQISIIWPLNTSQYYSRFPR